MQDITVTCLIACLDDVVGDSLASSVRGDMDLSCKIPAGMASSQPQLVVATLDINQGAKSQLFLCYLVQRISLDLDAGMVGIAILRHCCKDNSGCRI